MKLWGLKLIFLFAFFSREIYSIELDVVVNLHVQDTYTSNSDNLFFNWTLLSREINKKNWTEIFHQTSYVHYWPKVWNHQDHKSGSCNSRNLTIRIKLLRPQLQSMIINNKINTRFEEGEISNYYTSSPIKALLALMIIQNQYNYNGSKFPRFDFYNFHLLSVSSQLQGNF